MKPVMTHCPNCHHKYKDENIQKIDEREFVELHHLTCDHCHHYFLSYVTEIPDGISSISLATDASCEDWQRIYNTDPISVDADFDIEAIMESKNTALYRAVLDNFGKLT